jgi:hypothetical protein
MKSRRSREGTDLEQRRLLPKGAGVERRSVSGVATAIRRGATEGGFIRNRARAPKVRGGCHGEVQIRMTSRSTSSFSPWVPLKVMNSFGFPAWL